MSARERIDGAFAGSEPVAALRAILEGRTVWVVGGAIRDALSGLPVSDVDLATAGPASELADAIRDELGGHAFKLSDEFDTWRISGQGWSVDVARLRAPTIEGDLRLRDFSVNAVAVPLAGGEPIDPCGGIDALASGCLAAASPRSFEDDPLRLLRAARIGAAYGLSPDRETTRLARACSVRADEPAGERLFAELRGMIGGPDPLCALELMNDLGLVEPVLPELAALRGVTQSANHHLDVYEHTIEVLRRWLMVEADLDTYAGAVSGEVAAAIAEPLADGLTRREGIRFSAVLHDIGKPATRTERDGFVGFRGHDAVGAEMVVQLSRRLRASRRFADYQAALTRNHLVLGFMTHELPLSRRRIWDYIALTGREAIDVTLLTVADRLSAQGAGVRSQAIEDHLDLAREMLAEIVAFEREGPEPPLIAGAEIAELIEGEGEEIGAAVRELAAAQFAGEVTDEAAAEDHLRRWSAAQGAER